MGSREWGVGKAKERGAEGGAVVMDKLVQIWDGSLTAVMGLEIEIRI